MNKQSNNRISIMRDEPVAVALIKLGVPTMIGMLISALYNAIDAYFVGGLGMSQIGAVSVVFPIVQIVVGIGMMFGTGASSYISRSLGKGDHAEADRAASTALFFSILVGAVMIMGIMVFLDPVLILLGATDTILPYAREYVQIYAIGSMINVFTVTMNSLLTAQGATNFTMIAMLTGSISNVILDPIMIYVLDWGIEGAAIATVTSLCVTMALYIGYIRNKTGCSATVAAKYPTFAPALRRNLENRYSCDSVPTPCQRVYRTYQQRGKSLWGLRCGGDGSRYPYYNGRKFHRLWFLERLSAICGI